MSRRSLRACAALVALVACGGDPTLPPVAALPMPSASAIPSALPDAAVADAAPPDAAPPAASARRADVFATYDESLLFADEIAHLLEVSRELVAAQRLVPVEVLSPAEHADLAALFASGRLRSGGPVCALPPSKPRILDANGGGFPIVVRFTCSDTATCVVRAELLDGVGLPEQLTYAPELDGWGPLAVWTANGVRGDDVVAIERALRAAPVAARTWTKAINPPRPAWVPRPGHRTIALRIAGGWASPPKPNDFASAQSAIDACPGTKLFSRGLVAAVGPSGAVVRCEPSDEGSDPLAACACGALAKVAFGAATGERRLRLEIERFVGRGERRTPSWDAPLGPRTKADVSATLPETMAPEDRELRDAVWHGGETMAACFKPLAARRDDDSTVAMEIDDGGFVKTATLRDTAWMTDAQRACAQKAVMAMKLECPVVDTERHLEVTVHVGR